jgi:hypothetical protein
MEDGQRVRYYRLNTEDVEFAQKVSSTATVREGKEASPGAREKYGT